MASSKLLLTAAQTGDLAKIRARLAAGDDLESRHPGTGRTALLQAVIAGHLSAVEHLLDAGADIEASCKAVGHTALGWAVDKGHSDIVRLLLARGADVDAVAPNSFLGRTPLHIAAQKGDTTILTLLMSAGADLAAVDGRNDNALSFARDGQHPSAIALLEAAGAQLPEAVDAPEPLPWAALEWDPTDLADAEHLLGDPAPEQVVRSYILALHDWEIDAKAAVDEADRRGLQFDFDHSLDIAEHLTSLHTTDRKRTYARASIGTPPDLTPEFVLVESTDVSPSRRELTVRHPSPLDPAHEYEWCFVCLRQHGSWRIDSARMRFLGTQEWKPAFL